MNERIHNTCSNSLVGRYASHGDCMRRCLVTEPCRQGCLTTYVGSFHFLDDSAIHNVVDQVLVYACLLEKAAREKQISNKSRANQLFYDITNVTQGLWPRNKFIYIFNALGGRGKLGTIKNPNPCNRADLCKLEIIIHKHKHIQSRNS